MRREVRVWSSLGLVAILAAPLFGQLPAGWTSQDVGNPAAAGQAQYDPVTETWIIRGGGTGIRSTSDQFQYTYKTLSGDGELVARVVSLDPPLADNPPGLRSAPRRQYPPHLRGDLGIVLPLAFHPRRHRDRHLHLPRSRHVGTRDHIRRHGVEGRAPTAIDNDANLVALAELWFGAGRQLAFGVVAIAATYTVGKFIGTVV